RLARWQAELSHVPAVARGETDEAVRHYAAAARLVPANTLLLNEWAQLDLSRQDFAAAEEKLERSRRLDPTFDFTYAALADLYMALGNRAEAQRQAQQAWSEVPDRDRSGLGERLRAAGLVPGA